MLKGKRRLKARPGSLVDEIRKKEKARQGKYIFTREQKDRRNALARERYKNKEYAFGKEFRKEQGNEYYKVNKAYIDQRKKEREYNKILEQNMQCIIIYFFMCYHASYALKSLNQDIVNLKGKQLGMKLLIKEYLCKLKIKQRTKNLSRSIIEKIGLTADEVAQIAQKFKM